MAKKPARSKKPRKTGRPSEYKPGYCEMLIKHMGNGQSFESFAAVIRKNPDTLYEWQNRHPEFSDAHKTGQAGSQLFWEKFLLAGAAGKVPGFNAAAAIFSAKNRIRWRSEPVDDRPREIDPTTFAAIQELERENVAKAQVVPNKAPTGADPDPKS